RVGYRREPELAPQGLEDQVALALVVETPLVAVDDVAHDVGVGAPLLHGVAQPVDAADRRDLVAPTVSRLGRLLEHGTPRAPVLPGHESSLLRGDTAYTSRSLARYGAVLHCRHEPSGQGRVGSEEIGRASCRERVEVEAVGG